MNYKKQLLREFEEETLLPAAAVQEVRFFALIEDKAARTFDLCAHITLKRQEALHLKSKEEYESLQWLDKNAVQGFFERHRGSVIPTSLAIWEEMRRSHAEYADGPNRPRG